MAVAPFPTLARPVARIRSELWLALPGPITEGPLRTAEVDGAHTLDASDAIAHPGALLDAWLSGTTELTCCSLAVGLQLYVDGALWTGGYHDHFWHLGGWARLGLDLVAAQPSSTFVWDESLLRARIEGPLAMVWDEHVLQRGGRDAWWPIRCDRLAMARAIDDAGGRIDALRSRLVEALDRRVDRLSLPRFDPDDDRPRARDPITKLALIDHEVARRLDRLAFRELSAAVRAV